MALHALLIACAACGLPEGEYFGHVDPTPDPDHFRWCNTGEPEFIDPALATTTTDLPIVYSLFDGLAEYNEQGLAQASLATHWDISPDQRRFVFHMHDRGRWSNGRPITAHDFVYHLERVLSPLSFSRNADTLWRLKNGKLYTEGRVKMLLADAPPLRAGEVVEVIDTNLPSSNIRTAERPLRLRDLGAPESEAYATVPPGEEVTIVDLAPDAPGAPSAGSAGSPASLASLASSGGAENTWAYLHWAEGDGVYGWVEAGHLTKQPHGNVEYRVRRVPVPHRIGVEVAPDAIAAELAAAQESATVRGRDLLMVPEVLGVFALDDHTLVMETWGPVPQLIDLLPERAFRATPREAVSRRPLRWTRPEHIVTSGPFHLKAWHERDRFEMVRSETYWRRDAVRIARFTAYSMNDQAASTNYYMYGGCDAVASNNIPASYLPALSGQIRGRPYKDFILAPYLGIYFFLINNEAIRNVHLRRALSHAVDRRPLASILHSPVIPTTQHVPGTPISELSEADLALCGVTRDTPGIALIVRSGELCYVPPPGLEYNLDKARAELEKAKEELGDAFPKTLSLKFNTGLEGHKLIAEYVQHEWQEKLGITVTLGSQEWKTYLKSTVAGEYEIGRFGNIGNFPDPESEFLTIYRCGTPDNRTRFCSDAFERLMSAAESTADRKERLALLRKAEEVLVEEAPLIPLYVYVQTQLQKPYVRGLQVNLPNKPSFSRVWIDPAWQAAGRPERSPMGNKEE